MVKTLNKTDRNVTEKKDLLKLNPKWLSKKSEKQLRKNVIEQKKIKLLNAIKTPPAIFQFKNFLSDENFEKLKNILEKYKPENSKERKERPKVNKGKLETKPLFIKSGSKHVVKLIESEKAKLVFIAADVDPIEIVLFVPSLCKFKNTSYCIIKNQKLLGSLVNRKSAAIACIEEVRSEDKSQFEKIVKELNKEYLDGHDFNMKKWGNIEDK
uniref:60S ribosomal protein L7a n=1 Tax=Lepeophtheirus salmonis TaxID=72036 RepID=D3PFS0_LEPSM|nr:60S ribosomal protein L7a [Lepeophtheirus salmonis]